MSFCINGLRWFNGIDLMILFVGIFISGSDFGINLKIYEGSVIFSLILKCIRW